MIRVLRVIEYTYPDAETMSVDMALWTLDTPKDMHWKQGMRMKSMSFVPEFIPDTESETR